MVVGYVVAELSGMLTVVYDVKHYTAASKMVEFKILEIFLILITEFEH